MKIHSLIQQDGNLELVEVEVRLLGGVPAISFIGQADPLIKESSLKIKAALRAQGFQFPLAEQILVNLRPSSVKKTSLGLDLAVAIGILCETQQVHLREDRPLLAYGELTLTGEVKEPEDLSLDFFDGDRFAVFTGVEGGRCSFPKVALKNLRDLIDYVWTSPEKERPRFKRPRAGLDKFFSEDEAELIKIVAAGGFHTILAGPAGGGKSTLASALWSFLSPTNEETERHYLATNRELRRMEEPWRPLRSPHHTSTPLAIIGGGTPLGPGEITKADGGLLVLDEWLEYPAKVQEALREPMESGRIYLARANSAETFPARCQVIATTNLCPCGDWLPSRDVVCNRSGLKCHGYRERLIGPALDRFHILYFCRRHRVEDRKIAGSEILKQLEKFWEHEGRRFPIPEHLIHDIPQSLSHNLNGRRQMALARVALVVARLNGHG
ncbi:MAG TPA: ATP-binding protein, partial [Pseudobdellovibrionaceae bacterium]|nr:ATP-binding protein [Pseudobdellovibrionaceae bacterium]